MNKMTSKKQLDKLSQSVYVTWKQALDQQLNYDLLVIGGGVNGVGIARDAVGRGLSVLLCEQHDLASHTSSASTKLIHGGLRYLEHYEFGLVRKALAEREVLLRAAPHIVQPLRFVMPHVPSLRPAWMIRAGLFLYDHLSRRKLLAGSRSLDLRQHIVGAPLIKTLSRGFIYSDARVDDARLVALNALDAKERGATILTRTSVISATRGASSWEAQIRTQLGASVTNRMIQARAIVNAAGPWVNTLLRDVLACPAQHQIRMIKGSHIVTRKLFDHDHAYIFQNSDKRIIFAIPYEHDYTLIGTTDVEFHDDPAKVRISDDEIIYLCQSVNGYFEQKISSAEIVWSYAGVRPLLKEENTDDPATVTRDYRLELDAPPGTAPLLSVFGGKITTFRKLAEEAVDLLSTPLNVNRPAWTAYATLPGGDLPHADFAGFLADFQKRYPWLPPELAQRYGQAYGTRADRLLDGATSLDMLGEELSTGLYEAEVRYLVAHEWALSADDVLWRRTKLGLKATRASIQRLTDWLSEQINNMPVSH